MRRSILALAALEALAGAATPASAQGLAAPPQASISSRRTTTDPAPATQTYRSYGGSVTGLRAYVPTEPSQALPGADSSEAPPDE